VYDWLKWRRMCTSESVTHGDVTGCQTRTGKVCDEAKSVGNEGMQ